MIKKLRIKFLAVAMCSFALVLLLVLAVINTLNYREVQSEADAVLRVLRENRGEFPERIEPPQMDDLPGMELPPRLNTPEAPFENRFFSVILSADGACVTTDVRQIAAIDAQTAAQSAQAALETGSEAGWLGDYRFGVKRFENGDTFVVFLDCGRNLAAFYSYLRTSALLYVCALASVFVLLALLSGRIVRPISESNEKQRQFVTNAGHDIKTPLTIIDADAEVLRMDLGENEWVQDIQAQTRQLAALTANLISLSRMEEPFPSAPKIDFPFSDVVSELAQSFLGRAKLKNQTLDIRVTPMVSIHGDEAALRQLTAILLDNALKYAPEGARIAVSLEWKGKNALFTVSNPCAPISPAQIARLFDRFYRADPSRTPGDGYGIGLSIAKAVAQAHRGKIQARSKDGRSLAVTVLLPAGNALAARPEDD